jgi:hypothetical protein
MPSEASDTESIEEKYGKIEKGRALRGVLLEATKLAWVSTSQEQSLVGLELEKVVLTVKMLNHVVMNEKHFATQQTFGCQAICNQFIFKQL